MPQLKFQVEGADPVPQAAAPTIGFKLRISNRDQLQSIQSIALRCEIQIESTRRKYTRDEQAKLLDLFGESSRWAKTLRSMHWNQLNMNVQRFSGETMVSLLAPCSFDFNIAATKYFAGLNDGEVPLCFLFTGTVFFESAVGHLQVEQIPWDTEATYRLPVAVWQDMMATYYPNEKWLSIRSDVFERLFAYKQRRALATWEQAFESLLTTANHIDERPLMAHKAS